MTRYVYGLALVPLLLGSGVCRADDKLPPADEAAVRKTVTSAFTALKRFELTEFARHMHPEALKKFRDILAPVLEAADKLGLAGELLELFDGAKDVKAILALPPEDFFVGFMKGAMAKDPGLKDAMTSTQFRILSVTRGEDKLARVTMETTSKVGGIESTQRTVLLLRQDGTRWRMLLTDGLKGVPELPRKTPGA
jgi:hypothetical protein